MPHGPRQASKSLLTAITLFVTIPVDTHADLVSQDVINFASGIWRKTTSGCDIWSFDARPNLTITWSGQCVDGRVSGLGIFDAKSQGQHETYEGEMQNGKAEGRGIYHKPDGKVVEGTFHDGVVGGIVKYNESNGYRY